jgi:hypothetical protein
MSAKTIIADRLVALARKGISRKPLIPRCKSLYSVKYKKIVIAHNSERGGMSRHIVIVYLLYRQREWALAVGVALAKCGGIDRPPMPPPLVIVV